MTNEITNKTMAILIVLSLIVTISGTWIILDKIDNTSPMTNKIGSVNSVSEITLKITPRNTRQSQISGQVMLNIN